MYQDWFSFTLFCMKWGFLVPNHIPESNDQVTSNNECVIKNKVKHNDFVIKNKVQQKLQPIINKLLLIIFTNINAERLFKHFRYSQCQAIKSLQIFIAEQTSNNLFRKKKTPTWKYGFKTQSSKEAMFYLCLSNYFRNFQLLIRKPRWKILVMVSFPPISKCHIVSKYKIEYSVDFTNKNSLGDSGKIYQPYFKLPSKLSFSEVTKTAEHSFSYAVTILQCKMIPQIVDGQYKH